MGVVIAGQQNPSADDAWSTGRDAREPGSFRRSFQIREYEVRV